MTTVGPSNKDLREHWEYLRLRIATSAAVCVLSDFDGTLVELESHPELPRLEGKTRCVLEDLRRSPRLILGVVSGRSLPDLVPRIDLQGIWYVGNHGFEIRNPQGEERRFYESEDVTYVGAVKEEMGQALQGIPGVLLEHKGPVLAVHYRGVDHSKVGDVERGFLGVMDRHRTRLMMSRGHAVFEARLRGGANKGRAVSHIRHELPAGTLIMYFGDDLTDRDAFRELRGVGVSVEVGGGSSSIADYTLPYPDAVVETLRRIHSALSTSRESNSGPRRPPGRNRR
jgi:trehalose-phosphatase